MPGGEHECSTFNVPLKFLFLSELLVPCIFFCSVLEFLAHTNQFFYYSVFLFQYLMQFFYGGGDGLAYDTLAAAMVSQADYCTKPITHSHQQNMFR